MELWGREQMIGAFLGLFLQLAIVVGIIFLVRRVVSRKSHAPVKGQAIRRFFQYLLLLAMVILFAVGLSDLLARAIHSGSRSSSDKVGLARDFAFIIVAGPLTLGLSLWSRKTFSSDPEERESMGWNLYLAAATLISLVTTMVSLSGTLSWAVRIRDYDPGSIARTLIFGAIWVFHYLLSRRLAPRHGAIKIQLIASLISLVTTLAGLMGLLTAVLNSIFGFDRGSLVSTSSKPILSSLVTFVIGAIVWTVYWLFSALHAERDTPWNAYVLLAGIGGGFFAATISASVLLYSVIVWFIGDRSGTSASEHFHSSPLAISGVMIGLLSWWYHKSIFAGDKTIDERTEVRRIYDYLVGAIGLLAAAIGLMMAIVAVIELATKHSSIAGTSNINSLLAAFTLLLVGAPIWWMYWSKCEKLVRENRLGERNSVVRRIYIFLLLGISAIVAVATLITIVFIVVNDIIGSSAGLGTLRRFRYPFGLLISSAILAGYHIAIYRQEREYVLTRTGGARFVLLVGPIDARIVHDLRNSTGAQVNLYSTPEPWGRPWSLEELQKLVETSSDSEIMILAEKDGPRLIHIKR